MLRGVGTTALVVVVAACGVVQPRPSTDLTDPASVLNAYVYALTPGDCATGRTLATESFRLGNGELCGAVPVAAVRIQPGPPAGTNDELVFATTLTTSGSRDGTIPPGDVPWFYDLKRQPDGTWLLAGGGSGP